MFNPNFILIILCKDLNSLKDFSECYGDNYKKHYIAIKRNTIRWFVRNFFILNNKYNFEYYVQQLNLYGKILKQNITN